MTIRAALRTINIAPFSVESTTAESTGYNNSERNGGRRWERNERTEDGYRGKNKKLVKGGWANRRGEESSNKKQSIGGCTKDEQVSSTMGSSDDTSC